MEPRYQLTISRLVDNPNYSAEQEKYARFNSPIPDKTIEDRQLGCTITEIEFEAIKRALLEVWK